ncbi:PEP-CTERM sorting domain-containing protein [Nostoc sp. CHAB 5715]|uniref:PEP-CTERM sorting domain-containing protein n=1 Tax=Nostoc sp. CHAB 5715 TaxID=2780400 RepID=UPI001E2FEC45|nr:PEP-CTERM sorting domain-containing protein [Nostoc sp. CHAB 5715]MCC5624369.1 PEP-CTERM sorting domain-containing protein [Nostoc sp. CHAB 5715]
MLKPIFVTKLIALGLGLATLCTPTPTEAAVLTYQGDTTNQPTWRRTAPGDPPVLVSGERDGTMGMIVPYSVFQFVIEESGLYTFGSTVPGATSPVDGTWDNFLVLYQDSFNPTKQLTNVLIANTTPNNGSPAFSRQLTAQQNYFLVTTGRRVTDFGAFTNTISGSGKIVAVPESDSTLGTLAAVGAGLLLYNRKRASANIVN